MSVDLDDLLDYDRLRATDLATVFLRATTVPLVVLGSTQSPAGLDLAALEGVLVRRRRGGGGLVLLSPGDLWVDWWVPAGDRRWAPDVHAAAVAAGERWAEVLRGRRVGEVVVHRGRLVEDPTRPGLCFAGRGPGEVFVEGRKAVGVTQWRVREGALVSTVLPAARQDRLAPALAGASGPPPLEHATVAGLALEGVTGDVLEELTGLDGPWRVERPLPHP